jgi:hypothetical protein
VTISEGASLLTFLDAPVLVGDPESRVIYVNPCFERRFGVSGGQAQGEALAMLFSGGAREAMLDGIARVSRFGETVRFRIREGGDGYLALVSAIQNESDFLGVVILLVDEPLDDERLLTFHREMQEPLEEARHCLDELIEQTGGRRAERYRGVVERGQHAIERAHRWSLELQRILRGKGSRVSPGARLDPVKVVRQVAARIAAELEKRGASLDLLVPAQLASAKGDPQRLETALVHLLRERLREARAGEVFTLSSRLIGDRESRSIVISLVDPPRDAAAEASEPRILRETVDDLGGRLCSTGDPAVGRVTAIQLGAAAEPV